MGTSCRRLIRPRVETLSPFAVQHLPANAKLTCVVWGMMRWTIMNISIGVHLFCPFTVTKDTGRLSLSSKPVFIRRAGEVGELYHTVVPQ